MLKKIVLRTAAAAVAVVSIATYAAEPRNFNIPPGDLAVALEALAKETGLELIFQPDDLKGIRTQGVTGRLSPRDAVFRLIIGTRLMIRTDPAGAILIAAPTTSAIRPVEITPLPSAQKTVFIANVDSTSVPRSFWQRLRLAQNTDPADAEASGGAAESTPGSVGASRTWLDEVVVTAERSGEQRLQEVPISVSVLSSEELDSGTSASLFENLSRVPGVVIMEHSVGGAQVPIRGVAASAAILSGSSPTAYYFDGVPFGFVRSAVGPNPSPYDLERVEVLRGPQGTLYGASALNGVVRIITAEPNLSEFALKNRVSISATDGGGENYRGDVAVSVPIIEDRLAARAVLGYQNWSGWIDRPNKSDINDAELRDARIKLKVQPTEQLSIGLNAWMSRHDWGAPAMADDTGRHPTPRDMPTNTDFELYGATIGYDAAAFSISSVSSYIDYANESLVDLVPTIPLPATGVTINSIFSNRTFAQELLLNSRTSGNWRWSAGGIYRDAKDTVYQFLPGISPAPVLAGESSTSYAIFGELTRVFADGKWQLAGGLRYFDDQYGSTVSSPVVVPESTTNFTAVTPRAVLTWYPSKQLTLYGSYSEGFRSGLDQSFLAKTAAPFLPALEPDSLKNYEVGIKGNRLNGRLAFETAAYFMDWTDVQQSTIISFTDNNGLNMSTGAVLNGNSASGLGVDAVVTAYPTERLEFGATFSWNDLTMDAPVMSGGLLMFEKGERISFSAEYTAGAFLEYGFPLPNGIEARLALSANYTSAETHKSITAPSFANGQVLSTHSDSLLISRGTFSVQGPQGWTAALYVDNLGNEEGTPYRGIATEPWFSRRITPRVIGLQVQYAYGGK